MNSQKADSFRWRKRFSLLFGGYCLGVIGGYLLFLLINRTYLPAIGPVNPEPVFIVSTFTILGVLLTYRRPSHRIGWLFLVVAFLRQAALIDDISLIRLAQGAEPTFWLLLGATFSSWISGLTFTLLALIIVLFPTGSFLSPWWRVALWIFGLQVVLGVGTSLYLAQDLHRFLSTWDAAVTGIPLTNALPGGFGAFWRHVREVPELTPALPGMGVIFLALGAMALWSQFTQYRRGSPIIRQQIKWVIFAVSLWVIVFILIFIGLPSLDPVLARYIPIVFLIVLLVPISIAIAILRYRLWDIDILIRRTAIYGILTVILALIYFIIVTALQNLVSAVSDQQTPLVIVLSTLIIAALFNPLRRRIQEVIDRRFYRQKYDAELILTQFALAAREEFDPDQLADRLIRVVEETLQPERVTLWVKPSKISD